MTAMSFEARIVSIKKFRANYAKMVLASVRNEFAGLDAQQTDTQETIDWNYLLSCASVLALSNSDEFLTVALRIASSCVAYPSTSKEQRVAAALMLNRLSNVPGVQLVIKRKLIPPKALNDLPVPLLVDRVKSDFKHSILTKDDDLLFLNRFQMELYKESTGTGWLSVSAPTSAGKSFILERLIEDFLLSNNVGNVCFVVPTRALISQVESDLMTRLVEAKLGRVYLSSVPQLPNEWKQRQMLLVLTQERLKWLLNDAPEQFAFALVVVDEAQKIGDGHRGIILQQALEAAVERNPNTRVLFSSPQTENPEILLRSKPVSATAKKVVSSYTAVNQNLVWVDQVRGKPKSWTMHLCQDDQLTEIGSFTTSEPAPTGTLRLPYVAKAIGGDGGVLIYADYAAEAEKIAEYLCTLLPELESRDQSIEKLIKLVKQTVHSEYLLARVLEKGVAFHYGNMPTNLRIEIEHQFKRGKIKYLICTATLIEGVNLGARSVFLRGPRKGKTTPLTHVDFWNLAGRAGRLGADFQGNIVCIDVRKPDVWDYTPPTSRARFVIREASDISIETIERLITFINEGTPREQARKEPFLEYALSFYLNQLKKNGKISIPSMSESDSGTLARLETAMKTMMSKVEVPDSVLERNLGVSPLAQQSLLDYFRTYEDDQRRLIPIDPRKRDALQDSYIPLLSRIFKHLSGDFIGAVFPLGLLVVSWTRGFPMRAIVARNAKYWSTRGKKLPVVIRETMNDIEEFARFRFAKYSSCYLDVLRFHFKTSNREEFLQLIPDLHMWLEFGSSQETQISLMSLGLSRNAAISFSRLLSGENLTREQCAQAIVNMSLSKQKLASSVRDELERIKELLLQQ